MLTKENLLNFSHKNNESSWLTDLRIKSFERLEELDYPKMQRFSYQDWSLIKKEDFSDMNPEIRTRISRFLLCLNYLSKTKLTFTIIGNIIINHYLN